MFNRSLKRQNISSSSHQSSGYYNINGFCSKWCLSKVDQLRGVEMLILGRCDWIKLHGLYAVYNGLYDNNEYDIVMHKLRRGCSCVGDTVFYIFIPHVNFKQPDWSNGRVTILIIIPHVNFQHSDWSIGRVTILNVTRQCIMAMKFVVEMGHSV